MALSKKRVHMTSSTLDELFDRAAVDDISQRARRADPRTAALAVLRFVLATVAGSLYGLGWLAFKALAGLWFVVAWTGVAVATGWRDARGGDAALAPERTDDLAGTE